MGLLASSIDPWFTNVKLTSSDMRYALSALIGRSSADPIIAETGVLPGGGVAAFTPTSNGTSGAPQVSVAPGHCVLATAAGGTYICTWPVAANVTLTAPAGNPRIDVLCARVRDTDVDASGFKTFELITVDGTPASSPTVPVTPAGYLVLWQILVAASPSGALTMTDVRAFTRAAGGIRVCPATQLGRAGSYVGDIRVQLTGQIDVWLGSAWSILASPAVWSQFTPVLQYSGGGGIGAGTVGLGTGGTATGRWFQVGKRVDLSYAFVWNGIGNGGAGAVYTSLPPGLVSRAGYEQHILAKLYTTDQLALNWLGDCYIPPSSTQINPEFPSTRTDNTLNAYQISAAGLANTGIPLVPGGFPVGGNLILNGCIEVA